MQSTPSHVFGRRRARRARRHACCLRSLLLVTLGIRGVWVEWSERAAGAVRAIFIGVAALF